MHTHPIHHRYYGRPSMCSLQAPEARSDSVKVQPKRNLRTGILHVIFRDTSVFGKFIMAVLELRLDCGEEEVENPCSEAKIFYSERVNRKFDPPGSK